MAQPPETRAESQRCFCIYPGDPRSRSSQSLSMRSSSNNREREHLIEKLGIALRHAQESSLARGTKITHKSQLAYWTEFCSLFEIDEDGFGQLPPGATHPTFQQIKREEDVLSAFMAFVVACPRKGQAQNTANYALQCISAVRSAYANTHGRRPGLREGNKTGGKLRTTIRCFQKTNPSRREPRIPILQQHLRAIRNVLDLENNKYHKVLWALWLTQWQGVLRSSDLIKRRRDAKHAWNPAEDTHRGRLSVDEARDTEGKKIGARLKLLLKPNKTDQAGENATVKTFVIDSRPDALSAGRAILDMLQSDAQDEGREKTPLFRHPDTHKEITYEESKEALLKTLHKAGFTDAKIGTHSLRIGGATAYANAINGGYAVSGFMGLWASPSKEWYMHACSPRIDMAALEIGRARSWEVAERPGPVARYAS